MNENIRSAGEITYTLTRKRVKNINLRIAPDGSVRVSAPLRCDTAQVDAFVAGKQAWIQKSVQKAAVQAGQAAQPFPYSKAQCLALFTPVFDEIYPLFAAVLHGQKPLLAVRMMKTRWGVCAVQQKKITLNMRLAVMPREALEYVVLHEYVHFVHPDHQAGFHAMMAKLMPDYRQRRKLLR